MLLSCRRRRQNFFAFTLYKAGKDWYNIQAIKHAPVAQWIEHRIPVPRVGGSSPFRRTKKADTQMGVCFFGTPEGTRRGRPRRRRGKKHASDMFFSPGESPMDHRLQPVRLLAAIHFYRREITANTATSSKTGGYLNFCPSPTRAKMQTSPFRCTIKRELSPLLYSHLYFFRLPIFQIPRQVRQSKHQRDRKCHHAHPQSKVGRQNVQDGRCILRLCHE